MARRTSERPHIHRIDRASDLARLVGKVVLHDSYLKGSMALYEGICEGHHVFLGLEDISGDPILSAVPEQAIPSIIVEGRLMTDPGTTKYYDFLNTSQDPSDNFIAKILRDRLGGVGIIGASK